MKRFNNTFNKLREYSLNITIRKTVLFNIN